MKINKCDEEFYNKILKKLEEIEKEIEKIEKRLDDENKK